MRATDAEWEETFLWIRDKRGRIRPFIRNAAQRAYDERLEAAFRGKPCRHALVLKSRRMGVTTREQARNYRLVATVPYQHAVTLAQESEATAKIFEISRLFDECYRGPSKRGSKREIRFEAHGSILYIGTAGADTFGRGETLNRAHLSEVAQWPKRANVAHLMAGLTEACSHGELVAETTPRGIGDWFQTTWDEAQNGLNDWGTVFLPWWLDATLAVSLDLEGQTELLETLDAEEDHLYRHERLSLEQLAWRRLKRRQLRGLFTQEYPEDAISCFLSSGLSFFNAPRLRELMVGCLEPVEVRRLPGGILRVWHRPEAGATYDVGVDCSEGIPGGDYGCAAVLRREDGEQAAELHGLFRPEVLARYVSQLGREYNEARLAVERENHGHACLLALLELEDYPKHLLYRPMFLDRARRRYKRSMRFGWSTNANTRPVLLSDLATAIEGRVLDSGSYETPGMKINSRELLQECLAFKSTGTGRYEAEPGYHDDRVFAWGIAWQQRKVRPRVPAIG